MAIRARLIPSRGSPENYLYFILGRTSVVMETSNDPKNPKSFNKTKS